MLISGITKLAMAQEEPLLRQPFQFYSSYINLNNSDKLNIMERELVLYYKAEVESMKTQVELTKNECEGNQYMVSQLLKSEDVLKKKIEHMNNHIDRLQEQHRKDIQRQATSY